MFDLSKKKKDQPVQRTTLNPSYGPTIKGAGPRISSLPALRSQQAPKIDFMSQLKSSHAPIVAPVSQPSLGTAFIRGTLGSLPGRALTPLAEKIAGRKVDLSTLPKSNTLGQHAVEGISSLGAELPLWLGGEALLSKPLALLAKTKPVAKGIGLLPKSITPALGTGVKLATTYGGPINAIETGMNQDGLAGFTDRLKQAPLMGLGGVALHGGGQLIGKGISKAGDAFIAPKLGPLTQPLDKAVLSAFKTPSLRSATQHQLSRTFANTPNLMSPAKLKPLQQGIDEAVGVRNPLSSGLLQQKQLDAQSAFGRPRDLKKYSFSTSEQRASRELQDGIETAQNFVKHTDVLAGYPAGTTVEQAYADVLKNTGVDLPKLMSNWEKAQATSSKLTPPQLNMGRKAGVIPNLKPRLGPPLSPLESPRLEPLPLQRTINEKPQPLTWTNKDGIQQNTEPLPIRSITQNNLGLLPGRQLLGPEIVRRRSTPPLRPLPLKDQLAASGSPIDPLGVKDIGNFKAYTSDVYRIMRDALGKDSGNEFMKPVDAAKGAYSDMQIDLTSRLKTEIVDGLGIKKGSKESALVQRYGEGKITLEELKGLSPQWDKITKANDWFRKEYDNLIDQVNVSKKEIYPNAEASISKIDAKIAELKANTSLTTTEKSVQMKELDAKLEDAMRGKFIPKRADYYRHFTEMAEGVQGLKNIFDSPANISTQLIGLSEFSRPRSKWTSFAQKRIGNKTEEDAVGGFLNYIPSASYATHIDPQTAKLREFTQVLRDTTADTHNADTFIGFLDKYTNDLAGKTNPLDRVVQDMIPGGRKTFAALTWLNNRVKANVILGKFGTMLAQTANIPTGIAYGKKHAVTGLYNSVKAIGKPSEAMKSSPFLKERFIDSAYRQFDEKLIQQPKKLAVYLMETADKVGTNFVWNTAYAKALAEKVANPIRVADMATRDMVAGRGIGEVPLIQKSKLFQLVAPFQLEVANLWRVQKDMLDAKDFGGLVSLYILNYGFNEIMKETRGNKVVFDPIGATVDAAKEKDITPLQRGGRLVGEFISNVPLGQTIASAYPEFGTAGLPSRKALFGATDPTRFGSGLLINKAIEDPLAKLALPFGGEQIKKTYQGIKDLKAGGHVVNGKLSYPVESTPSNAIKGALFGPGAFTEARDYYKNNQRPLSVEQTKKAMNSTYEYNKFQDARKAAALKAKVNAAEKIAKEKRGY